MNDGVFIVLFRGVGGATQLPVKQLQAALTEAGFRHVRTYIATGNVVLASELKAAAIRDRVAEIAKEKLGFDKAVIVRTRGEWSALAKQNPFPKAAEKPRTLHAFVLESTPSRALLEEIRAKGGGGPDEVAVRGKALYLHTPEGFGRSRMPMAVERALQARTTARNWNTVVKLKEMADDVAAELRKAK